MLKVIIEGRESYDAENDLFHQDEETVLELEHSLLSLSKWESKHQKPFLSNDKKVLDEIYDYLKAMVVTPNADLDALNRCTQENLNAIQAYIDSPQSATTFGNMPERRGPGEVITAELIYYWMVIFNIPWEAQTWHLNRLFALIRICNIKQSKPKRMSPRELAQRNKELNDKRRAALGTKG